MLRSSSSETFTGKPRGDQKVRGTRANLGGEKANGGKKKCNQIMKTIRLFFVEDEFAIKILINRRGEF